MTLPPSQKDRAHNLRIVGTISNGTETLDWEPINPSSWPPRHTLHLAGFFTSASTAAKFIATLPFPLTNTKSSSWLNPRAATSSVTSEIVSLTKNSLANNNFLGQIKTGSAGRLRSSGRGVRRASLLTMARLA
jgi:hypothetical protein